MIHARITNVTEEAQGDELVADAASGATVLYVKDVADFSDEDEGGYVVIDGTVYEYVATDDDAATITLAVPTTAAYVTGQRVDVWDADLGTKVIEYVADCTEDGIDGDDPLQPTIDHSLADRLNRTPRSLVGESVTLEYDQHGKLWVTKVHGKVPQADGEFVYNPLLLAVADMVGHFPDPPTNPSWPDSTWQIVQWNCASPPPEIVLSMIGSTSTYFTITAAGVYDFRCGVTFASNSTGARGVRPHFDYANGDPSEDGRLVRVPASGITGIETSQLVRLEVGDRISFYALQTSGAALDMLANNTTLSIMRVSA